MTSQELREKFLRFMKKKGHTIIPSASLIPENDPTTLFTGSGMQPMVPYLLGEKHPAGKRIADSQKSFRTPDIEDVGDNRHTTFFEMLGNWSLGDYFKKEQIEWIFEFLIEELELDPKRVYVSVYRGNKDLNIPRDEEAVHFWQEQFEKRGVEAEAVNLAEENGMQNGRIFYYSEKENWWSRSGLPEDMPEGEPGGPDSEMFWDFGAELKLHENSAWKDQPCHPACDCGRFLEIGNSVFMQYIKTENGFKELENKNIDFGGGLERMSVAVLDTPDVFRGDLFDLSKKEIERISGKKYGENKEETKAFRIIMDHLRAATFLINDGALPSNKDQGYFTRRLIRRAVRFGRDLGIKDNFTSKVAKSVIETYKNHYVDLVEKEKMIVTELEKEEKKFGSTLFSGIKKIKTFLENNKNTFFKKTESGTWLASNYKYDDLAEVVFDLYQTHGFPIQMTFEELKKEVDFDEKKLEIMFQEKLRLHRNLSRTASAGKFKGGLADASVETTKLHTAAHLLLEALRRVLGDHVFQKGSNITGERLRFDFSHGEKMTEEQKQEVEKIVNEQIEKKLPVVCEEMTLDEAKKQGAMGVFESKYGEKVKVYAIDDFSKEICGGPHVENTSELGHFKIKKEESSSARVRRIKAVLE